MTPLLLLASFALTCAIDSALPARKLRNGNSGQDSSNRQGDQNNSRQPPPPTRSTDTTTTQGEQNNSRQEDQSPRDPPPTPPATSAQTPPTTSPPPVTTQSGDLGVRFNKFAFLQEQPADWQPLGPDDYPMDGATALALMDETNAASVMVPSDYELHGADIMPYTDTIGGLPSYPEANARAPYWAELEKVTDAQIHRRNNGSPWDLFTLPALWSTFDVHQVAEAVHDEYPGSLQVDLITWLWQQGVELDYEVMPYRCQSDFLRFIIGPADLNTWAIRTVAPLNFHAKWTAGRPRPEEVAWMIANDELTTADHNVPASLVTKIKSMNLNSAAEFTAYPEGSPRHPSWPAMHSAASSASFWLDIVYDLTPAQLCEARRVDYAVAYARTVAGVHYPTDNIAGLNLGQEIMAEKLADHLVDLYGADRSKVQAKIDASRFDWNNFDTATCQVN